MSRSRKERWYQSGIRYHSFSWTKTPVASRSTPSAAAGSAHGKPAMRAVTYPDASEISTLPTSSTSSGFASAIGSVTCRRHDAEHEQQLVETEPQHGPQNEARDDGEDLLHARLLVVCVAIE